MTRNLLKTVAIIVIALAPLIAAGSAEAHGGGFHAAAFTAAVSVEEALVAGASEATDFGLVGFSEASIGYYGSYYPGHYGYGPCYLTVYGTTYCY
jgi:hypothetical protein